MKTLKQVWLTQKIKKSWVTGEGEKNESFPRKLLFQRWAWDCLWLWSMRQRPNSLTLRCDIPRDIYDRRAVTRILHQLLPCNGSRANRSLWCGRISISVFYISIYLRWWRPVSSGSLSISSADAVFHCCQKHSANDLLSLWRCWSRW